MQDSDFEDIRPYRDHEFKRVIKRIISHKWILRGVRKYACPRCPVIIYPFIHMIIRLWLKCKLAPIKTIDDFHTEIIRKTVLQWVEDKTTSSVTWSGEEHITRDKSILYITNHRDIVLDSSFLCMILMDLKLKTPEIAFGDNLLMNQLTSDLIRINKSFIVKRNLPLREQIVESIKLSRYILYTLRNGHSIWLAQREGRAKNGDDRSNPSIIKMLYLSQRKRGMSFSDFINTINIMPVAVSYQLDPCDSMKARELWKLKTEGVYKKKSKEDLMSIVRGIRDWKDGVHYAFNPILKGEWKDAQHVAETIDRGIHGSYHLWPENYIAFDEIHASSEYRKEYTAEKKSRFLKRFAHMNSGMLKISLEIYAKPVENREALRKQK